MSIEIRTGVAPVGDVELAFEDWGDISHPPLLLIMGLSAQLLLWPDGFCEELVKKGYRVIRFDNRDIGLSTKIRSKGPHPKEWMLMARAQFGLTSKVPYTLHDMKEDVRGLLDYLKIEKAHVVGASMGGMIAQLLAATYPERVASLSVVFSSTNQPLLPPPAPSALLPLMKGPGPKASRDQLIKHSVKLMSTIGSPKYLEPRSEIEAFAGRLYDRSFYPAGVKRQMMAILGTGNLKPYSQKIKAPTVVIHGGVDPLLKPACGKAVAKAIKGSELKIIKDMGHDLPRALWGQLSDLIINNAKRAV